jgi:hemoglobin/transferrin/lactoferrin receptor protein
MVRRRARLLLASSFAGALLAGGVVPARAQPAGAPAAARMAFAIPAQPLPAAINAFIRQTGWQVGYPGGAAAGKVSRAVSGTMPPEEALRRLIAGTGLRLRLAGGNTASLVPAGAAGEAVAVPGAIPLDTITVTGIGTGAAGPGTLVIGPRELERKNPSDVRGVFAGEPGVKVGGATPMSQKVYVNGVEETNLAVSIDGSRQNNKVFHHNGTTLIDPAFLKVARVDAGIAAADAGPGALAGAIAYETRDARDMLPGTGLGAFAKSSFNSNGNVFTQTLSGYGRTKNIDLIGYFTIGRGARFEAGNGQKVAGTATDAVSGYVKLGVENDNGDRLQVSHERVQDDAARPFRGNIGFITGRPAWEPRVRDYRMSRDNSVLTYSRTAPAGWWDPKIVLAYSRTAVTVPIYTAGGTVVFPGTGETDSINGRAENRFNFALGSVTAGLDFYKDRAEYRDRTFAASERSRNFGAYAQARLKPWERVRVSFGLRGDSHHLTGTRGAGWSHSGLSYNGSGEIDLLPDLLVAKAGYARVWSGAPLAENFILNTAWNYGTGPRPVTSDNVSAALEARYRGFTLEGKLFQTRLEEARAAKFAAGSANLAYDIRSRGYELALGYAWADGFIKGKYVDIDVTINDRPTDTDAGQYLATPVGRIFTLTAAHTFRPWGVTVGGDMEFAPRYSKVAAGAQPFRAYHVVNAFAEFRPERYPDLAFRAEIRNLLDRVYADRATYQGFGTVTPLYQPGRSVIVSASSKF